MKKRNFIVKCLENILLADLWVALWAIDEPDNVLLKLLYSHCLFLLSFTLSNTNGFQTRFMKKHNFMAECLENKLRADL